MIVMSEISFLTTGVSLIPESKKIVFKRYAEEINKCYIATSSGAKDSFNKCLSLCDEF